jgi:hypothetical protein
VSPTLVGAAFALGDKAKAVKDLLGVYEASGDLRILDRLHRVIRRQSISDDLLLSVIRTEARSSFRIRQDYKKWLREAEADLEGFEELTRLIKEETLREPLLSCTSKQLLAMKFDRKDALDHDLALWKSVMAWASSGNPMTDYPLLGRKVEPKDLKYYQSAPNGLYEIHMDCSKVDPLFNAMLSIRCREEFLTVTLAWLKAEADGKTIRSLEELVPEYLPAIPTDPADGQLLRCLPEKRIIYSIGANFEDEQGLAGTINGEMFGVGPNEPACVIPTIRIAPEPDPFAE